METKGPRRDCGTQWQSHGDEETLVQTGAARVGMTGVSLELDGGRGHLRSSTMYAITGDGRQTKFLKTPHAAGKCHRHGGLRNAEHPQMW